MATDGIRIYENAVEGASSRGMHIIVLNQQTGQVMSTRIFDTYAEMLDGEMLLFLKMLQEGRIVIFLVKVSLGHPTTKFDASGQWCLSPELCRLLYIFQ